MSAVLSLWTIYDHPRDYPDAIVARRWEIGVGEHRATADHITTATLSEMRQRLRSEMGVGAMIPREPADDRVIVETWL